MKKVCFISGSPRGKESVSTHLLNELNSYISDEQYSKCFIDVKHSSNKNNLENDFKNMKEADIIVIAFPLYVYCLPGLLTRFLEEYYLFMKNTEKLNKRVKVYAIVNCGFPEPEINTEAIRVIKNFCHRLNLNWRFGLSVGMGGMIQGIKEISFMKRIQGKIYNGLKEIKKDMDSETEDKKEDVLAKLTFPSSLYLSIGSKGWIKTAKINGLSQEALYKKPYVDKQH